MSIGRKSDLNMTPPKRHRSQSELWAPVEWSIDDKLGAGFSQVKRDQLFAVHQASAEQQEVLVSNNLRQGGNPDDFFRDYVKCERFFFSEAAEVLGPDDFMTLFGFPLDKIDEHLKFDHLIEQTVS